jgi:hypothetical protein
MKREISLLKYLVLIFIFNLLWCSNIFAFKVTTSGGKEIKWNTSSVTYYVNSSGGPSGSLSAIQAAMQTWTDVATSIFTFVYGGTTTSTAYGINDGFNIVVFGPMGTTGTLAENYFWFYTSSGQMIDSDIKFNTDYPWAADGSPSAYDVQNVGTHEFGHSLSLDDLYKSADSEKTMYGYASMGEMKKRTLDQDDVDGITYLYPSETLSVSLTADPSTGTAPLNTTLTADVSGTATGTINYTFWWNCDDPGTSVDAVMASCGSIPTPSWGTCASNSNGYKCNGVLNDPKTVNHTYSSDGTYIAKVIAERGSAPPAEDRVTITVNAPTDTTPPMPNPMTWATQPYAASSTSILMVATTATDSESPSVYYYFDFVDSPTGGTGGSDSSWQSSTSFTDTGLQPNHRYGYRVKSRDSASTPNESSYSSTVYEYTLANVPGASSFSNMTQTSIQANWTANGNRSGTEYWCENVTKGTNSGWITATSWNSTGLTCGTSYAFRVKARNGDNIETGWTNLGSQSTQACGTQYSLNVNTNPSNGGTVTGPNINCPGDCSESYASGTNVALNATANYGYTFSNWTGCDLPSGYTCNMTMNANKSVTANFIQISWTPIPGLTASSPALAWNPSANKLQMVVRASNDTLWASTFNSSGVFNNDWVNVPGLTASPPALAWNPVTNKMHMVVRASNNTLWASTFNSSGVFNNDWVNIPGLTPDAPALAWNPLANEMQLIVRGSDGSSIWTATFNSSGAFNNDWVNIPGGMASSPALAWNPVTNEMQMVVRASNSTLWASTFNSSGVFNNDWINVPGLAASSPVLAWSDFTSSVHMMVMASNDTIWASTFNSLGNFNNDWLNIPGLTSSSPGMAYLPSIGYLGIVVRASDDSLWEMLY